MAKSRKASSTKQSFSTGQLFVWQGPSWLENTLAIISTVFYLGTAALLMYLAYKEMPASGRPVALVFFAIFAPLMCWMTYMMFLHPVMNKELEPGQRTAWMYGMFFVPVFGAVAYAVFGSKSKFWRIVGIVIGSFLLIGLLGHYLLPEPKSADGMKAAVETSYRH